jgi:hypothetical protein
MRFDLKLFEAVFSKWVTNSWRDSSRFVCFFQKENGTTQKKVRIYIKGRE